MNSLLKISVALVALVSPLLTHASIVLTAEKYTELLLASHPKLSTLELQSKSKTLAKELSDPFGYSYNSSINSLTEEIKNGITAKNADGSTSSANHTLTRLDNNSFTSNLSLQHTIPLHKNKGGINDILAIELAEIDIQIDALNKQKTVQTLISNELRNLINLRFNEEKLNILKARNELDTKELSIINDKFAENLVDKTDVLLQESALTANKIDVTTTLGAIKKITGTIQTLLNISDFSASFDLYAHNTQPLNSPTLTSLTVHVINELEIKKREREITSLKNQEEDSIDFSMGAVYTGANNAPVPASLKGSLKVGLGLEIAFPVYSDTEHLRVLSKYNEIAIIKEQMKEDILSSTTTLEDILSDINTTRQLIANARKQITINEERYVEYQALYENNNTELDFVLTANTALVNSRLSYIEYLKNYHLLLLDFKNASL